MKRSLYPDGINVDRTVLEYTELSKIEEILRNRVDWTSRGIFSGGAVTVGAVDDTRIDVAAFSGFVPSGEFVECTGNVLSNQLDSSVLNAVNYVCAFYTEAQSRSQTHETDGQTYATRATGSYRVRVYEESNFLALPSTDANLANDARDRALILAKVTGNGAGVTLTTSNLFGPTTYNNILYADPLVLPLISGVILSGVSPDTATGLGSLAYTVAPGPVYSLQWTPFAGGAGVVVNPTADGSYVLFDGTAIAYIVVDVVISQLSSTTPLSDPVTIINLYAQEIPRQTAEDYLHRNMLGGGVPTQNNPHATTLNDLSGSDFGLLTEHQDVLHSNGIWKQSSPAIFDCSISFPIGGDVLSIFPPAVADLYYINGRKLSTISPTTFQFIPPVIPSSASGCHFYELYVDDDEVVGINLKASFPDPRTISGVWIVDMSEDYPIGGGTESLALTVNVAGTVYYTFSWGGGEAVTVDDTMDSHIIRLFAANATDWIDLFVNTNDVVVNPDAVLPGVGAYNDAIVLYASPDWTQALPIASLCGWWDVTSAPARFAVGFRPYSGVTRSVIDKRIWGTLATDNMSDSALQELAYSPQDELHYSGVLYSRNAVQDNFEIYGTAALAFDLRGGAVYCRGQRLNVLGTHVTLANNITSLVYVNTQGTVDVLDVTTDFAGSMVDALAYLVGRSQLLPETHADPQWPERGVALWEVLTAGGAVVSTKNIMRNVNGPVNPWSVAAFTGQPVPVSSFNSLYSAFNYINATVPGGSYLEVLLTGLSVVDEGITQPAGVVVKAVYQTASVHVQITDIDATGAWKLTRGCAVEGVTILYTGEAGVAIKPDSDCVIRGCNYIQSVANSDVFLFSADVLSNVIVENNIIGTRSGAVVFNNVGSSNIQVRHNIIAGAANNSALGWGLIQIGGSNLHVTRNKVTTDNSVDFTPGILIGSGSSDFHISKNTVRIGDGSGVAHEYGVHILDSTTNSYVTENIITCVGGGVSEMGIGIGVLCGKDFNVVNNVISLLGAAIRVYGTGIGTSDIRNGRVCQNSITSCYHRGISIDLNAAHTPSIQGLKIGDNRIYSCVKGAAGLGTWGNELYGIRFYIDVPGGGPHTTLVEGLQIHLNDISELSNAADKCYGVYIKQDPFGGDITAFTGLSVNENTISTFLGANNMLTAGVYVYVIDQDISTDNFISGNTISTWSSHVGAASEIYGIFARATANLAVNNNIVTMKGVTTDARCDGIVAVEGCTSVSGNTVTANWCGIYIQPAKCVVSGNSVVSGGIGIFIDVAALKTSVSDNLLDIYAYNDGVYGHSGCGGVVCSGEGSDIVDNKIILTGTGVPVNVPDETAMIHVIGDGCNIIGNSTHLGVDVVTVGGAAPSVTHRAFHIYYGVSGGNGSISNNKVNNYVNASSGAFNGIWMDQLVLASDVFILANSNHVRGRTSSDDIPKATGLGVYPYEYMNMIDENLGNHRWILAVGNIVTSEDLVPGAATYPGIYFNITGLVIPQQPTGANRTNFATNWSPTNFW